MPKKSKKKVIRKSIDTAVIPTADNAKWVALGFLAAGVIVMTACLLIFQAHIQ